MHTRYFKKLASAKDSRADYQTTCCARTRAVQALVLGGFCQRMAKHLAELTCSIQEASEQLYSLKRPDKEDFDEIDV